MSAIKFHPIILIPVYNHEEAIGHILPNILKYGIPILLVDDGSNRKCQNELQRLESLHSLVELLRLDENQGKGGAVKAGMLEAHKLGYSHALQIDADGQHCSEDIPLFVEKGKDNPEFIICGHPMYDESVPALRYYARYLTHIWVWINSMSLKIKDSMCGFRLYPLEATVRLIRENTMGNRMDFDSEVLVHWIWSGGDIINRPTKVTYPIDGVSHFAPLRDNYLISKMHAKLFFLMLAKSPRLIARKINKRQNQHV